MNKQIGRVEARQPVPHEDLPRRLNLNLQSKGSPWKASGRTMSLISVLEKQAGGSVKNGDQVTGRGQGHQNALGWCWKSSGKRWWGEKAGAGGAMVGPCDNVGENRGASERSSNVWHVWWYERSGGGKEREPFVLHRNGKLWRLPCSLLSPLLLPPSPDVRVSVHCYFCLLSSLASSLVDSGLLYRMAILTLILYDLSAGDLLQ